MLETLSIQNFKSIKQGYAKIPAFGAIVGSNGAGKSNLIQAIDFVKKLVLGQEITVLQKTMALIPDELFHHNHPLQEFSLKLDFSIDEEKFRFEITVALQNGGQNPKELCVKNEKLQKAHNSQFEVIYRRDDNSIFGKNNDQIPLAVDKKRLVIALYKNDEANLVRNFFNELTIIQPELDGLRDSMTDATADNLSNLLVRLHQSQPEYKLFNTMMSKMLPAFSSIVEMNLGQKAGTQDEQFLVLLQEKNLKRELSMKSISSGDLKTLFLIATAVSLKDGATLLIEEIENATHPKRVKDLVDRLEKISAKKDLQIVFTTHSPTVINSLPPQEILYTKKDDVKGTDFTLLSEGKEMAEVTEFLENGGDITEYIESIS